MATKTEYASQENFRTDTQKRLGRTELFVGAIALVTLISFITLMFSLVSLILTYQRDDAKSYQDYRDELRIQSDKIENLKDTINQQKTVQQAN